MGKRGPRSTPTAVKLFRGTRAQKPVNPLEPVPKASGCPPAPKWLQAAGKLEWNTTGPLLHAVGCLTDQDLPLFGQYCQAWEDYHNALEDLRENGFKAVGSQGNDILNPAVKVKYLAMSAIKALGAEFGLTPASRVGMKAAPQDEGHDDLDNFKRGAI